jgi:hypothetical protein
MKTRKNGEDEGNVKFQNGLSGQKPNEFLNERWIKRPQIERKID